MTARLTTMITTTVMGETMKITKLTTFIVKKLTIIIALIVVRTMMILK